MTQKSAANPGFGFNPQDDLNDLRMSDKAIPLLEHVKRFCAETVEPKAATARAASATERRERNFVMGVPFF